MADALSAQPHGFQHPLAAVGLAGVQRQPQADVANPGQQGGHIGTLAVNPYIFDKLPYDPARAFTPVSLLAKVPTSTSFGPICRSRT